jgi:hypothetical protein
MGLLIMETGYDIVIVQGVDNSLIGGYRPPLYCKARQQTRVDQFTIQ